MAAAAAGGRASRAATLLLGLGLLLGAPAPAQAAPGLTLAARPRLSEAEWSSYHDIDHMGPGTYAFGYDVEDAETGNTQFRQEERLPNGTVAGSYGLVLPDGSVQVVHYVADHMGYRARVETMDPRRRPGETPGHRFKTQQGGAAPPPPPPAPARVLYQTPAPAPVLYQTPAPAPVLYQTPAPAPALYQTPVSPPAPAPALYQTPAPPPSLYPTPAPAFYRPPAPAVAYPPPARDLLAPAAPPVPPHYPRASLRAAYPAPAPEPGLYGPFSRPPQQVNYV